MADGLNFSRRLRRTPYTASAEAAGVTGFSVVNHMLLPKAYGRPVEEDYWHLREHVQIWDVACQRQVQIAGRDAARLVQWMTPRDISRARTGDCLYVPITDETGGMINDPVLLKLADDRFWLSAADSDLLLFAKGLALGCGLDVTVDEPDVSPLAVQGPKAETLLCDLFGGHVREIGFFKFDWVDFTGTRQLIARSGYSRQGGFEIYLNGGRLGAALWDAVCQAGQPYGIAPGYPNLIDRIEGGILSYGNEMTREQNPFEIGMGKFCSLNGAVDYLGRNALQKFFENGAERQIRGVLFDGGPCPTCAEPWPVNVGDRQVGQITSAIWSPRLRRNVGLSLIDREFWDAGQPVTVHSKDGTARAGEISALPFA
ncbi:MAG: dimethylsulfoniopropionate demethylase [Gammaproteobacteria bacterium]|nr:dimethylsulfoniopropionate demethylase [Gammaproteobacteria bacterium]